MYSKLFCTSFSYFLALFTKLHLYSSRVVQVNQGFYSCLSYEFAAFSSYLRNDSSMLNYPLELGNLSNALSIFLLISLGHSCSLDIYL